MKTQTNKFSNYLFEIYKFFDLYIFIIYTLLHHLSGNDLLRLDILEEVVAHILLEVEVSKLISLLELKESSKLGIGVNLATIRLVLELVGADVGINLLGNSSASQLGSLVLSEESSKLVGNLGGLHKARGGTVASLALALGGLLLGSLKLAGPLLLKTTVLSLKSGDKSTKLGKLTQKLGGLLDEGSVALGGNILRGNGRGGLNRGSSNRGSLGSLGH